MEPTPKPFSFASRRKVSSIVTYNEQRNEMYVPTTEVMIDKPKIHRAASAAGILTLPSTAQEAKTTSTTKEKLKFADNHGHSKQTDGDSRTSQIRRSILTYTSFKPIPCSFSAEKTIFDNEIDFEDLMELVPNINADSIEDELMTDQQLEMEVRLVRERRSELSYIPRSKFVRFVTSLAISSGICISQAEPSQILPNIYIGSYYDRCDGRNLVALGITHILNMTSTAYDAETKNFEFITKSVPIADDVKQVLSKQILTSIIIFCHHAINARGKLLIHCKAGTCRAPMALVVYLLVMRGVTIADGITLMHKLRPCVNINRGFLFQVALLEIKLSNASSVVAKTRGVIDDVYNFYEWNRIKVFKPRQRNVQGLYSTHFSL